MWNTQGNGGVGGGDRPLDGGCSSRWSKSGGGNSVGDPEVGGGGNWYGCGQLKGDYQRIFIHLARAGVP